ncbi:MAG: DUF4870 domain-containing protein [Candidatus Omnitrophica bacterium]|nr:DUF4870 domain-containing protein [Candidatus Omnitrophota bacterium]
MAGDPKQEKVWAMFCHLGALAGYVIPFGNIIAPLVLWMIKKDESALIDKEGKKALNFQISITIYAVISLLLVFLVIGIVLLWVIGLFNIIMIVIAALKVNKGEEMSYPLSISFMK